MATLEHEDAMGWVGGCGWYEFWERWLAREGIDMCVPSDMTQASGRGNGMVFQPGDELI